MKSFKSLCVLINFASRPDKTLIWLPNMAPKSGEGRDLCGVV